MERILKKKSFNYAAVLNKCLVYTVLVIAALTVILPLVPIFIGALKEQNEFSTTSALQFPKALQWKNFYNAFIGGNMLASIGNTIIVVGVSLVISVMFGAMTSYVLDRFTFRGKLLIKNLFLLAALIPSVTGNIAMIQILAKLRLYNTRMAGILLFSGTDIISVYIFLQFLSNISISLDESAKIDGTSYFRIFFSIILPLLAPAVVTVLIIKGVSVYNDFTTPFLFMPRIPMISTALFAFKDSSDTNWPVVCASVLIVTVPIMALFLVTQKWIYGGFVSGSVKE